jgi:uncharacterized membrane protein
MDLCKYKNALGVPRQGVHSLRVFDVAILDVISTIIGAYILSRVFRWTFWKTLLGLFLLGVGLHRLFCVRTTVDRWIFGDK